MLFRWGGGTGERPYAAGWGSGIRPRGAGSAGRAGGGVLVERGVTVVGHRVTRRGGRRLGPVLCSTSLSMPLSTEARTLVTVSACLPPFVWTSLASALSSASSTLGRLSWASPATRPTASLMTSATASPKSFALSCRWTSSALCLSCSPKATVSPSCLARPIVVLAASRVLPVGGVALPGSTRIRPRVGPLRWRLDVSCVTAAPL